MCCVYHEATDKINDTLNILEGNGGQPCYKLIKAKIPTYCTINIGVAKGGLNL